MSVEVQAVHQVTGELVDAAGCLLPQLSRSAAPLDAEGLARIAKHQAITLFVARSQGRIVGMLTLVTFPLPSGLRARIEDVVVDQDARGQGVGTALTMAALDQAQAQGARSIDLTSRASRVAANRLYQQVDSSFATPTSTGISPSLDPTEPRSAGPCWVRTASQTAGPRGHECSCPLGRSQVAGGSTTMPRTAGHHWTGPTWPLRSSRPLLPCGRRADNCPK